MEKIEAYQTSDGKSFKFKELADLHEKNLEKPLIGFSLNQIKQK